MVDSLRTTLKEIQAPWVFAIVLMATAVAIYLLTNKGLSIPHAAYGFSAILVGGFIGKALLTVGIGAMRTMMLLVTCTLTLVVVNVTYTDAGVFKDAAVEGMLNVVGGGTISVIGALLDRLKNE